MNKLSDEGEMRETKETGRRKKVPVGAIFRFLDIPANSATKAVLGRRDVRGLEGLIVGQEAGAALVRVDGIPFPKEVGIYGDAWRVSMDRIEILEPPPPAPRGE